MEDKQTSKLNMGAAVVSGLLEPESDAIISINPMAVAKRDQLEQNIKVIEDADEQQQSTGSGGEAISKEEAKHNMADQADIIAQALCGYALDKNDNVLYEQMNYHAPAIFKMKDTDSAAFCVNVITAANANLAALAPYNITPAMVSDLKTAVTTFGNADSAPRTAQGAHHTATQNISLGIVEMLKTLLWWDHFVATLRISQHDFYTSYKSWRKTVTTGVRHVSVRGLVKNSVTATPLYQVKTTVVETGGKVFSGKTGKFRLFSLKPGVYTLTFELTGYQTVTIPNVSVQEGKITDLAVALVKL